MATTARPAAAANEIVRRGPARPSSGPRSGPPRAGGPNRYGVNPDKKGGIVSLPPYFDEPKRHDGPRRTGRQDSRPPEPQKPAQGGNWFTRFLKKKKTDYKNE